MRAVPVQPEPEDSAPPAPLSRRRQGGRPGRPERRPLPARALAPRLLTLFATTALSALIALSGFASPRLVVASVVLGGLVLAWGWPVLLGLPSPRGTMTVLALATVLCSAAAGLTRTAPFLRWVPAALAVSVIIAFAHQLLRRDGRPRLTESIAASASGLAVISSGVALGPLPLVLGGAEALAAAMAAVGVGALADLCIVARRLRPWALPIAMVLGGASSVIVSQLAERPQAGHAVLLGVLVAAVSHAARRVIAVLPSMVAPRAQLAAGATSVLVCGVVVYAFVRSVIA